MELLEESWDGYAWDPVKTEAVRRLDRLPVGKDVSFCLMIIGLLLRHGG